MVYLKMVNIIMRLGYGLITLIKRKPATLQPQQTQQLLMEQQLHY